MPDGTPPNLSAPYVPLITQGLTAEAYENAAYLTEDENPSQAEVWRNKAARIRALILEKFWIEEDQFLAMGLDHDPDHPEIYRHLARASDAGAVLRTNLLQGLSDEEIQHYIVPIATRLFSSEFLVDEAGVVCLSRDIPNLLDYIQYQGQHTVWIKEQEDIAAGLELYGLYPLADFIRTTMINAANKAQALVEFLHVTEDGRVNYDPLYKLPEVTDSQKIILIASDNPTGQQTWSATANLHAKRIRTKIFRRQLNRPLLSGWRKELVERLLEGRNTQVPKTKEAIIKLIPSDYRVTLDIEEGKRRVTAYKQSQTQL